MLFQNNTIRFTTGHNMEVYLNKKFVLDVFKDVNQNTGFINNGFFITDFLSGDEVAAALAIFDKVNIPLTTLFHSHGHNDYKLKAEIDLLLKDFIKDKITRLDFFAGYKIFSAVYINKSPNATKASMKIHSDDSLCDERKFMPFNIWIPLVDVSDENGTFCMIKGSHLKTPALRGTTTKDKYLLNNKNLFLKEYDPITIKKGQAMVYHPGCVHFSNPNNTPYSRPAIAFACMPVDAQPSLFFERGSLFGKKVINRYDLSLDEINHWNNKSEPAKQPAEVIQVYEK